jgi:hypothetical protein
MARGFVLADLYISFPLLPVLAAPILGQPTYSSIFWCVDEYYTLFLFHTSRFSQQDGMASEILVSMSDAGVICCRRLDPIATDTAAMPLDQIQGPLSSYIFVFQEPTVLEHFFKDTTSPVLNISNGMRKLRLDILHTVSTAQLTPLEENGGIDGPNLSVLVEGWRTACRSIPRDHHIEEMVFDMSCGQPLEIRHIIKLLQQISTTTCLKASGTFHCYVQGCDSEKKAWLEASLVSTSTSGGE